ncbi:ribonuclease kappa [Anaeramoeba ignava]|uniref:Ribonuclease kappa n=1 Tax=Anaeramoeba ignava TaxID=1746090 RepID=A0A9Q0LG24_ANAIG|nr:ribonuclease kappa [Anaeramoeba ignava]
MGLKVIVPGLKCAVCCIVLGFWGTIMLTFLGILFYFNKQGNIGSLNGKDNKDLSYYLFGSGIAYFLFFVGCFIRFKFIRRKNRNQYMRVPRRVNEDIDYNQFDDDILKY